MERIIKRKIDEDLVDPFPNPEELMPLPDRLKQEAPVSPLEADSEASEVKDISTEAEVVETDSEDRIKSRERAHANKILRR
ncbi:MAG: hypothetical protein MUO99_05035 [Dehalococcoidales bacterium]|nr:hypothetical protein [Dehalococcoidales bacterium]